MIETVALNLPVGLGTHVHWDRKLDGRLAQAIMSIHSVKGVEIGDGFATAELTGEENADEMRAENHHDNQQHDQPMPNAQTAHSSITPKT